MRRIVLALIALLGAVGAVLGSAPLWSAGPLGMIPGGALKGEEASWPEDWSFVAHEREVALEVAPERPRSVTVWFVAEPDRLVVSADFLTPFKRWPYELERDPRARVRVAGRTYRVRAERVRDPVEIERLRAAFARKYELRPDGWAARVEVWFFRLGSRES